MDELSKLLQIKEYVLEIKLQLAKLHTQKEEAIQSQYYEKASEIREKERDLKTVLLDTRKILLERRLSPLPSSEQLKEHEIVLSVISELSIDDELKTTYQKIRNEFYEMLQTESKRLLKDKHEFLRIKEEWAVKEVHRQLLEIGDFLSKVCR
jgi:hypothetical protein